MAISAKNKASRSRKGAFANVSRPSYRLSSRYDSLAEEWDKFADELAQEIRLLLNDKKIIVGRSHTYNKDSDVDAGGKKHYKDKNLLKLPPAMRPAAIIRSKLYAFIVSSLNRDRKSIAAVLEYKADYESNAPMRRLRDSHIFSDALMALRATDLPYVDEIDNRARFADVLLYAQRHSIPAALLEGFIWQSGGVKAVCEKVKNANRYEPWHPSHQPNADKLPD